MHTSISRMLQLIYTKEDTVHRSREGEGKSDGDDC